MKNSIIFYIVLLVGVFGGVKWTSHAILEKKKAVVEKTNFHSEITQRLTQLKEPVASQLQGKKIVLYYWGKGCEECLGDLSKLNSLMQKQPDVQVISLVGGNKEETQLFLAAKKIQLNFPVVGNAEWFSEFSIPVEAVFGKDDDPKNPPERRPEIIVMDVNGKIKMYSIGRKKDIFTSIEQALR